MFTVKQMPEFSDWLDGLKDSLTRARILKRLNKVAAGNLGDAHSVGEQVTELREHFGPGWRLYYTQRGNTVIILLGGGDKSTQLKDIALAKTLAQTLMPDEEST
jgi:putative addiction module killer protein